MFIVIILAALFPAILLWGYVWKIDKKKEPISWLLKATLYGVLIVIPVIYFELLINIAFFLPEDSPSLIKTTAGAFFGAAIPEEVFKLLALWLILKNNPYFDEHFDGIVYAVCVSLGLAAVENIFYLFDNIEDWMTVAFFRSLLSVPGHYAFAILMGYYYSKYHFVDHSPKTAAMIIVAPVLAHGMYDALLMTSFVNEALGAMCFFIAVVMVCRLHVYARKKLLATIEKDGIA